MNNQKARRDLKQLRIIRLFLEQEPRNDKEKLIEYLDERIKELEEG